jgi:hypothetical protein
MILQCCQGNRIYNESHKYNLNFSYNHILKSKKLQVKLIFIYILLNPIYPNILYVIYCHFEIINDLLNF